MQSASRTLAAAAAVLVLLLAGPGHAELELLKPRRVFLAAADDSLIAQPQDAKALFAEAVELKGKGGCLLVRYSGEHIGTDLDENGLVSASFELDIENASGQVPVAPFPNLHQVTTSILPQVVSFSAFACGLPPGIHNVVLRVEPSGDEDQVSTLHRTLEIWVQKGRRSDLIQ